ncbi:hypothetical protein L1987_52897 [Smallanthus sonchifolius]|uniref:Uncharacterized protein n=1 Tax=Smallanthus sonchifolius TaxID=185202 RepID=A0ACB9EUF5_9ASTR|nr:hypothetical protein L1987_52897 [Smallanthus sonchifolius]
MVKEKHKPSVEVPPPSNNRNGTKSQVGGVKWGVGRTFSEVVCNARGSSAVDSNVHQECLVHVPDETRAFQELYGKALVGRCVDVATLTKLNAILNEAGFRYESLSYIGGLSTLIKFDSEELGSDLLNNHEAWGLWFTSLEVREDEIQVAALEVGKGSSEINNGDPFPHVALADQPQSGKEKRSLLDIGNDLNRKAPPFQFPFESQGSGIRPKFTELEEGEIRIDGFNPRELDLNAVASSGDPGDSPSGAPSLEGMAVDLPLETDELELSATVRMGNIVGARLDNFLDLVKSSIDGEEARTLNQSLHIDRTPPSKEADRTLPPSTAVDKINVENQEQNIRCRNWKSKNGDNPLLPRGFLIPDLSKREHSATKPENRLTTPSTQQLHVHPVISPAVYPLRTRSSSNFSHPLKTLQF